MTSYIVLKTKKRLKNDIKHWILSKYQIKGKQKTQGLQEMSAQFYKSVVFTWITKILSHTNILSQGQYRKLHYICVPVYQGKPMLVWFTYPYMSHCNIYVSVFLLLHFDSHPNPSIDMGSLSSIDPVWAAWMSISVFYDIQNNIS